LKDFFFFLPFLPSQLPFSIPSSLSDDTRIGESLSWARRSLPFPLLPPSSLRRTRSLFDYSTGGHHRSFPFRLGKLMIFPFSSSLLFEWKCAISGVLPFELWPLCYSSDPYLVSFFLYSAWCRLIGPPSFLSSPFFSPAPPRISL